MLSLPFEGRCCCHLEVIKKHVIAYNAHGSCQNTFDSEHLILRRLFLALDDILINAIAPKLPPTSEFRHVNRHDTVTPQDRFPFS